MIVKSFRYSYKNMEKSFGKGAVMKLGDNKGRRVSSVSSGSVTLDNALGVGGYPKGRIIEIYGPESSGKTTVALHAIAEVQRTVALLHLSTLNTRLIRYMQKH